MLRETFRFRSYGGRSDRRVYSDSDMDLYVWFTQGVPERFHLIYNKRSCTRSVSWNNTSGFGRAHFATLETVTVMVGLSHILDSFIEQDKGDTPASVLAYHFLQASNQMTPWLADFIYARLLEYPGRDATGIDQGTVLRSF